MLMMSKTCLKQTCCTTFSADETAFCPVQISAEACCCSCRNQHRIAAIGIRFHIFGYVLHDQKKTQQKPKHESDWDSVSVP